MGYQLRIVDIIESGQKLSTNALKHLTLQMLWNIWLYKCFETFDWQIRRKNFTN